MKRNPVPFDAMAVAEPPNQPSIRAVGFEFSPVLQEDFKQSLRDENEDAYCTNERGELAYCTLLMSGGGGFGAFGSGFLNGWTEAGTRPNFKIITGISTGALAAPFAFVGPEYDDVLKTVFTTVADKDVYKSKGILALYNAESFMNSAPLANLIATWIDEKYLAAAAKAHANGRRLYIGTTNLDRQEFVVWNMGAIASSNDPDALELFRKVMLASASVPGIFPPVFIDVEVDGVKYDEMHSDGAIYLPVFFHAFVLDPQKARDEVLAEDGRARPLPGQLYVLRAGLVYPEPEHINPRILPIIRRALATTVKSMSLSSLYFIYAEAQVAGLDFNYVSVPQDFDWQSEDEFDTAEMNRLYQIGFDMAKSGYVWRKLPPQFRYSPLAKEQ